MKTLGRYELLDRLGEGSMGVIYRAKDMVLDRQVALKTLSTAGVKDAELLERFYREARACARLRHPNIVTVYDFGREKDAAYIAMELLEGSDLKKIITRGATMPLEEKLRIMAAVCDGLAHAHSMDIVHRDVKPSNIFVTADGQPRILDFGVAHMPLSSLTIAGRVLGTPYYMSPEQMLGQACDGRSDIFSTAIVAFELIAGERPFRGAPMERITGTKPDSVLTYRPDIPMEVDDVLRRALAREPGDRYASAGEFAARLRETAGRLPRIAVAWESTQPDVGRPVAGTETIMSAVLINLREFEDAADRGDLGVARQALVEMRRAGAQNSRYAVALEQSAKRLAEIERVEASLCSGPIDNRPAGWQPAPPHRPTLLQNVQNVSAETSLGAAGTSARATMDATVLFDDLPVGPPAPPTQPPVTHSIVGAEPVTSGRSRSRAPRRRSRAQWVVWGGVLAVVACVAAFVFTKGTDHELESLPAAVAVPSVSEPPAPAAVDAPTKPHTEAAAISHMDRASRRTLQRNPVEVKAKPVVEPVLDLPPQNLVPARPTVAPIEPAIIAADATPPAPLPVRRVRPDLETQRKAGQELLQRMLARLGQVDSPPALSLSGSAILFAGGQRSDWNIAGNVNVKSQTLSLEIQGGGLKWRTSLQDGTSKAEGSGKLKGSGIAIDMEWLANAFYADQPAVLAARFKAASATQIVCDLSTDEQGDRVLQVQAGTDRYAVLIAPDGTPLRLHHAGVEMAYAGFADVHGYLYPRIFALRSLAANAPPATVVRFDAVTAVPTLFENSRRR